MKNQTKRIPYKFLIGAALFALGLYLFINYDGKLWYLEVPAIVAGVILCVPGAGKSKVAAIALGMLLAFGASAQPNPLGSVAPPPPSQPVTLGNLFSTLGGIMGTNWYGEVHGMYAPKLQLRYGGGLGVFSPFGPLTGTTNLAGIPDQLFYGGVRLDWVDGGFWMPSGNVGLQYPLKLLKWTGVGFLTNVTVIPLAYAGLGIPVSGSKINGITVPGVIRDNNGQMTGILGYGFAIPITKSFGLVGDAEKWTGFAGTQYRAGMYFKF